MIRYVLQTFAGPVEVQLDVQDPGEFGLVSFGGPDEAIVHIRRDVLRSYGHDGRLLDGPVCAADLRIAMASPALVAYAPRLLDA